MSSPKSKTSPWKVVGFIVAALAIFLGLVWTIVQHEPREIDQNYGPVSPVYSPSPEKIEGAVNGSTTIDIVLPEDYSGGYLNVHDELEEFGNSSYRYFYCTVTASSTESDACVIGLWFTRDEGQSVIWTFYSLEIDGVVATAFDKAEPVKFK